MLLRLIILFIIFGCNKDSASSSSKNINEEPKKPICIPFSVYYSEKDSIIIGDSLYSKMVRLSEKKGYNFSFNYHKKKDGSVVVESNNYNTPHKIEYSIQFTDSSNNFDEESFNTSLFKYKKSFLKVDNKSFDLNTSKYLSDNSDNNKKCPPVSFWQGDTLTSFIKYIKFKNKEYILLKGTRLGCMGRNCSGYTLFIIEINATKYSLNSIEYAGIYPFNFENTFLLDADNDDFPEIYLLKGKGKGYDYKLELNTIKENELVPLSTQAPLYLCYRN